MMIHIMIYNLNTIMMTKPSVTKTETKQNTLRRDSKIKLSVERTGWNNASPPLLRSGGDLIIIIILLIDSAAEKRKYYL